jgi:predicted DNA-binding protein (MmcQ/YjbR family)
MDRQEVIDYCLTLLNTFEDYPFPDDNVSVVMKHTDNKKWFALIMEVRGEIYLNIKTDPYYSELLRKSYDYIIPAYHMNKELWNTVIISRKVDKKLVKELIEQSYELTKSKIHK